MTLRSFSKHSVRACVICRMNIPNIFFSTKIEALEETIMLKLNLQLFAHKKGMGSTRNGRDSESKRLGPKRADGQFVLAGNILVRQRGTKILPGLNVGIGKDDTLFAKADGIMKFERKGKFKKQVSVHPVAAETVAQ